MWMLVPRFSIQILNPQSSGYYYSHFLKCTTDVLHFGGNKDMVADQLWSRLAAWKRFDCVPEWVDEIQLQGNKQTGCINIVACSAAHSSNENPFHVPPSTEKKHSEIRPKVIYKRSECKSRNITTVRSWRHPVVPMWVTRSCLSTHLRVPHC